MNDNITTRILFIYNPIGEWRENRAGKVGKRDLVLVEIPSRTSRISVVKRRIRSDRGRHRGMRLNVNRHQTSFRLEERFKGLSNGVLTFISKPINLVEKRTNVKCLTMLRVNSYIYIYICSTYIDFFVELAVDFFSR